MAMTARKKTSLGYYISAGICVGLGIVFGMTDTTPEWVTQALSIIGLVATAIGIPLQVKDVEADTPK
ncbi:MAG: hypothetical protein WC344_05300 [Bacilli bacterium]